MGSLHEELTKQHRFGRVCLWIDHFQLCHTLQTHVWPEKEAILSADLHSLDLSSKKLGNLTLQELVVIFETVGYSFFAQLAILQLTILLYSFIMTVKFKLLQYKMVRNKVSL